MSEAVISMKNVHKSFEDLKVLGGISFEVAYGEKVSLVGPGGSGKSTILKLLLGLIDCDEGEIYLGQTPMHISSEDQKSARLKTVGMAFQQGALFDYMSVEENILFAMEHMTQMSGAGMQQKIRDLLSGVKLPKAGALYPHELSGGMQRRIGIARALSTSPEIAIFDEPTAGLDPVTSTIILNMIHELVGEGKTSLVCTSNVEIGMRYADRMIVINDGVVVADGLWRELLLDGPEWVRHFLAVRLIGLDLDYARGLDLPKAFIESHWT
jgi:phospholipid/cholesterol/gamma-HCH transport system ATP-binding protein